MKIQTILGKVRYQQDFFIFFNKVIVDIKFKTVKMTVVAVLVLSMDKNSCKVLQNIFLCVPQKSYRFVETWG